jgi:hypothetical protein
MVEVHVTNCVKSRVGGGGPPGNVPIAVNCRFIPLGMEAVLGVTAIEVGPVTEMLAVPSTEADRARMVEVPAPTPLASPFVGGELLMVATVSVSELQVTDCVMSAGGPVLKKPIA